MCTCVFGGEGGRIGGYVGGCKWVCAGARACGRVCVCVCVRARARAKYLLCKCRCVCWLDFVCVFVWVWFFVGSFFCCCLFFGCFLLLFFVVVAFSQLCKKKIGLCALRVHTSVVWCECLRVCVSVLVYLICLF